MGIANCLKKPCEWNQKLKEEQTNHPQNDQTLQGQTDGDPIISALESRRSVAKARLPAFLLHICPDLLQLWTCRDFPTGVECSFVIPREIDSQKNDAVTNLIFLSNLGTKQ